MKIYQENINQMIYLWLHENKLECRDYLYQFFLEWSKPIVIKNINRYKNYFSGYPVKNKIFDEALFNFLQILGIYKGILAYWKQFRNSKNSNQLLKSCVVNNIKWLLIKTIQKEIKVRENLYECNELKNNNFCDRLIENSTPEWQLINDQNNLIKEIYKTILSKSHFTRKTKLFLKKLILCLSKGSTIKEAAIELNVTKRKIYSLLNIIRKQQKKII